MSDDYADFAWLTAGGWRLIDEDVPVSAILETVQATFADIPAEVALRSFQGGRWPLGNWHWEPEGYTCSSEPTHWRPRPAAAVWLTLEKRAPVPPRKRRFVAPQRR